MLKSPSITSVVIFFRDHDGTYCYGCQTYVKQLMDDYKMLFGELPTETHSPLDKDDKPELDETPLLGPEGIETLPIFDWCLPVDGHSLPL